MENIFLILIDARPFFENMLKKIILPPEMAKYFKKNPSVHKIS